MTVLTSKSVKAVTAWWSFMFRRTRKFHVRRRHVCNMAPYTCMHNVSSVCTVTLKYVHVTVAMSVLCIYLRNCYGKSSQKLIEIFRFCGGWLWSTRTYGSDTLTILPPYKMTVHYFTRSFIERQQWCRRPSSPHCRLSLITVSLKCAAVRTLPMVWYSCWVSSQISLLVALTSMYVFHVCVCIKITTEKIARNSLTYLLRNIKLSLQEKI